MQFWHFVQQTSGLSAFSARTPLTMQPVSSPFKDTNTKCTHYPVGSPEPIPVCSHEHQPYAQLYIVDKYTQLQQQNEIFSRYFVVSVFSTSVGAVIGALDWPPTWSSPCSSPFVELTTWQAQLRSQSTSAHNFITTIISSTEQLHAEQSSDIEVQCHNRQKETSQKAAAVAAAAAGY